MSLILVPASRANLELSIEKSINSDFAKSHLGDLFFNELTKITGNEGIRCFAMTKNRASNGRGKMNIWGNLRRGDEVLFIENKTNKFTHYGIVLDKIHNENMGKALWSYVKDDSWEYIYFLGNITNIDIDRESLVVDLGWERNYKVPGVMKVPDEKYIAIGSSILNKYGIKLNHNIAESIVDSSATINYSSDNIKALGLRRIGQYKFSRIVKKNYNYSCAICGISEPELLIAGHIQSWSVDHNNRLNPSNGICLCSLHDKAFEHGYIGLDQNYHVIINKKMDKESKLYNLLESYVGKKITLPNANLPDIIFLKHHREKHNF